MRKTRNRRWFSGTLVTGLVVAAVLTGHTGTEAEDTSLQIRKADFHITEHITEGVIALTSETMTEAALTGSTGTSDTTADADTKNALTAGQGTPQAANSQSGATGNTGTGTAASGTITAGGGSAKKAGPSVMTTIVTEGEKGASSDPILGGATLTMLNSQSNSQMLSAIIETSQGNLIVVDGGLGEDGDYLLNQIRQRGGHVSAWLITHPHGDHVGALYKILQNGAQGIQIDGIYYSLGNPEWYTLHDPEEQTMAVSFIGTLAGLPQEVLHPVSRNQFIQVDDVIIQVMNDRYELSEDKGNNAGIVYKILINGKKILFLGDLGEAGGKRLLADCGAEQLQADIVQMAHHGQNGVNEEFYRAVNPSICLWPAPTWLWNNDGNKWRTPETKTWMTKSGDLKHYVMKDGDQVIR